MSKERLRARQNNPPLNLEFTVAGTVGTDQAGGMPPDLQLKAYLFDRTGQALAISSVDPQGCFQLTVGLPRAAAVQIVIGPECNPETIRRSDALAVSYSADDWEQVEGGFVLRPHLILPRDVIALWRPIMVTVRGLIHRNLFSDGVLRSGPVPFVKVEVFEVDRDDCWWPLLKRWWDLVVDQRIIQIPELLKERDDGRPFPWADPLYETEPPRVPGRWDAPGGRTSPSDQGVSSGTAPRPGLNMASACATFCERLKKLTLISTVAPWITFPRAFHQRQLVAETVTDASGYFQCAFRWSPFQLRRGRYRFDAHPDLIIRVTQVIDGAENVSYLDPYSSTRWNGHEAEVDLWLDSLILQRRNSRPSPLTQWGQGARQVARTLAQWRPRTLAHAAVVSM